MMKNNMKQLADLIDEIHELRMKMIETGLNKGLNNTETLHVSQQLDYLLFTYQELSSVRG
jgi:hypothetical protein